MLMMRTLEILPSADKLDAQRADYLQTVHPNSGVLEADITAKPILSRRHKITRGVTRVAGVIGLASAAFGVIDTYTGATQDIPEAKTAVVQEIEAIDMRDTDTAITTGLFTEQGAAKIQETGQDVQSAVNRHSSELEAAFNKTSDGAVQAVLGGSMLIASIGVNSILKRRATKQQGEAIELESNGTLDQRIFPDALYSDRLTARHISRNGPQDTSQVLELRPSMGSRNRDQWELSLLNGAAGVLTGLFIASGPIGGATAEAIDTSVTVLRETPPVASVSNHIAQKATEAAEPKLTTEIKKTTSEIVAEKLPKTERLAQKLPLIAAVKDKLGAEIADQMLNTKPQNTGVSESHAMSDLHANALPTKGPVFELVGVLGLSSLALTRVIRRRSHLQPDVRTKVLMSEAFLQANINPVEK